MRKLRAFTDQALHVDQEIELEDQTSHHLLNVLRLGVGSRVILFNGKGGEYLAELSYVKKGSARAHIIEFDNVDNESALTLNLYQGVSRGDKMDFALQKATELGVTSITPIITEHSQFKINEKQRLKKQEHWQQVIINAAQQCWRCTLPTLNPAISFENALSNDRNNVKLFFHTQASHSFQNENSDDIKSLSLYIGPEGGFSDREAQYAKENDANDILLGPRILRTETATVAALSLMQFLYGDF